MAIGLVGRKCGMTRVFQEDGTSVPVSVIEITPNRITQVKTKESDGYSAVQIAAGVKKASSVSKPEAGLFAKAGVEAGSVISEFRVDEEDIAKFDLGGVVGLDVFKEGQMVDVSGVSKGKGFAGGVKRWGFAMQDATHGNSLSHRAPGSIGQCQTPGRVFKGKKMAGQLGNKRVSIQSLEVVKIDVENNLLLIKGAIPGATGSNVVVSTAVKTRS
ncbi:MAG: 50S ribosomal protein L3 [Pseudomonadales bacterium]|nr:50S ribosomal protein L3 [Pseudomonadales bacterium]